MKTIYALAALAVLTVGMSFSYHAGRNAGYQKAHRHYVLAVAARVESQMTGIRRVQAIRETSAYHRGWNTCMEQF